MDSDRDLLDKADALLRRHATAGEAESIPLLTDLVEPPAITATEGRTGEIAREVFALVLKEVEGRLAADLERRLSEHLVPQVQVAVASAMGDLRQELANAIGDAVARALKQQK